MNTKSTLTFFSKPVSRKDFVRLIKAALSISEYRFARQASLDWLASFPGDLEMSLIFAKSLVGEGKFTQAIPVLEKLCSLDPEYEDAFKLLDEAQQSYQVLDSTVNKKGVRSGLKSNTAPSMEIPEWKLNYFASQKALADRSYEDAERLIQKALVANPASPIPAIHQMNIFHKKHDFLTTQNLAEVYHQRWPECLQFTLYLTESFLRSGDEARAVSLLHHCVALDSTGQVVKRLWGMDHPYKNLWPEHMEIKFTVPIPANVSMVMGWNQLQPGSIEANDGRKYSGEAQSTIPQVDFSINDIATNISHKPGVEKEPTSDVVVDPQKISANRYSELETHPPIINQKKPLPEDLASVQTEFQKIAKKIKQPQVGKSDGRYPVFVLLSSRIGLEKQYGAQTTNVLDLQMKNLAVLIQKLPGWESMVFFPDDPAITAAIGINPILVNDPWKIKLSLADLDNSLIKKGQRIGAILIVGGPDVVPFHHLPNPTDDSDPDVPSDNPYATSDENYFVPEWPVGRLLGEAGSDPGMLLEGLRKLTADYTVKAKRFQSKNAALQFIGSMNAAIIRVFNWIKQGTIYYSFGYSARVWQDASSEVYKTIGQPKSLMTSPPVSSISGFGKGKLPARLAYYNLHGIQDGPEWYGQKCPEEPESIPDYPVALSPKDIQSAKSTSEIIFSEACYGAYLNKQKVDDSIALKFLASGTQAFVGSTCVSYGSITKPLIAADLLAQGFWTYLKQGQSAGVALLKSKVDLAQEMSKRQGYLDGEDQKTLLSFVLYGDPLATLTDSLMIQKSILRSTDHQTLKTVSDRKDESITADQLPPIMMANVKEMVSQYLPGLKDAEYALNLQSCTCKTNKTQCNGCKLTAKGPTYKNQKRVVVTLTKSIKGYNEIHRVYARMTLDPNGKVIKLSTSR